MAAHASSSARREVQGDTPRPNDMCVLDGKSYNKEIPEMVAPANENLKLWVGDLKIKDPDEKTLVVEPSLDAAPSFCYTRTAAWPPPPVVPLARSDGPLVPPDEFVSPGDWGYQVQDASALNYIMYRKTAARRRIG